MSLRVLEIVATLAAPIAGVQHDVHLDGLIAASWVIRQGYSGGGLDLGAGVTRSTPASEVREIPLPIASVRGWGGDWCWMASAWDLPEGSGLAPMSFTKRRDSEDVNQYSRAYTPSSGPGRDYHVKRPSVLAPRVSWIAVADRHEIRNSLKAIREIGSVRRQGYGRVVEWTVTRVDRPAVHALVDERGRAARNLPVSMLDSWEGATDRQPVRAPYWHAGRAVEIVRPGTPCALKAEVRRKVDEIHSHAHR